jgi:hypothetical protein
MPLNLIPMDFEAGNVCVVQDDAAITAINCLLQEHGRYRSSLEVEISIEPGALKASDVLEFSKAEKCIFLEFCSREIGGIGKTGQIKDRFPEKDRFTKR